MKSSNELGFDRKNSEHIFFFFFQAEYWTAQPLEFPRLKSHGFASSIPIASRLPKIYWMPKNWRQMVHCGRFYLITILWNFEPIHRQNITPKFIRLLMSAKLRVKAELFWVEPCMSNQVSQDCFWLWLNCFLLTYIGNREKDSAFSKLNSMYSS